MLPSAKEIVQQAQQRQKECQSRLRLYDRYAQAYFGDNAAYEERMSNADGRPALRQMRNALGSRPGPNMILPIVDDFVALRGRMPQMAVVPWDTEPDTDDTCKRLSRALRSQWLHSDMVTQLVEGAWYATTKGEFLATLTAVEDDSDPEDEMGVYITVVDPACCFPKFATGWKRHRLENVIVVETVDAIAAREKWGVRGDGERGVNVYHYIGQTSNGIVVGDTLVDSIDHELGFCPAEWVRTKPLPRDAQSDIAQIVDLHAEFRVMFAVLSDSLIESTYAQVWIRNPAAFDDRFEIGPGADPIVLKGDGMVGRLAPQPPPEAAVMTIGQTWEQITRMSGSAPVRTEQQVGGSNISGRAITAVQGPMEQRLQLSYEVIASFYERLNAKIMRTLYQRKAFHKEMTVYGTERGGTPYVETFSGDEFKGWTRNKVSFGSSLGGSSHERSVVALQLRKEGLVTGPWVLEQMEVDDPERLYAEARAEQRQAQGGGGALPGAAPPSPTGGPGQSAMGGGPGGAPIGVPSNADAGSPPGGDGTPVQPPPPPMPGFAPVDTAPSVPGKGFPGPLPNTQKMISDATAMLADPKSGMAGTIIDALPVPGGVRVLVTSPHDKPRVRAAFHRAGFADVVVNVAPGAMATSSNGKGGK